jgi:hypothetical protein
MAKGMAWAMLTLAVTGAATAAGADELHFNDFSNTAKLQINGNAASVNTGSRTVLRVTPSKIGQAGSVFSTTPIALSNAYSFSTRFTFNINQQYNGGADGLVFVVQPNANDVGGGGGGIGFDGIPHSLGIEFDTWDNTFNGVNEGTSPANHIGVDLNGNINSVALAPSPYDLDSGTDLTAWIDYNGSTKSLEVRLANSLARPGTALITYGVDLASVIGNPNAFVGFTSGTGAAAANHDLVSWDFIDNYAPISGAVPEPATWAMMIVGFGAAGYAMRRRKLRVRLA